jgi:RNA polymerase sigma-70 factor (ECF subfamily)
MNAFDPISSPEEEMQSRCDDFVTLMSRHSRRIYGYIRSQVLDVNDANDVFQDTTYCMWKKFSEFSAGTNFFAWGCRIAHLQVLKFRETHYRQFALSSEVLHLLAKESAERAGMFDEREAALGECVQKLSGRDRHLLEQRYYQEQKPGEIAQSQSRSVFAIYRSLTRIHGLLFRCIERSLSERRPE